MRLLRTRVAVVALIVAAFAARAQAATLTLTWDANSEPDVAGYVVLYGLQPGIYTDQVDVGPTTTAQLTGLAAGSVYYFAVSAYNTAGEVSDPSLEVSGFAGSAPEMSVDTPADGATVSTAGFALAGWALDRGAGSGSGVDALHVWAYPDSGAAPQFVAIASYGNDRPDVGAAFGAQFTPSGFATVVTNLAPGGYRLVAYAHSTVANAFSDSRAVHVTVAAPASLSTIAIDTPRAGDTVPASFLFAGWTADFAAPSGTGIGAVHVWAYPASGAAPLFAGIAALGWARPDVGAIFGSQFTPSGYGLTITNLPAGSYQLVAYAFSTVTGTFNVSQSVQVTVRGGPLLAIDAPGAGGIATQPIWFAGWTLDPAAPSGTGTDAVHVWAYPSDGSAPIFAGLGSPNLPRPDVGSVFGSQFTNCGYGFVLNALPPGTYTLVPYVHSATVDIFTALPGVQVTIAGAGGI